MADKEIPDEKIAALANHLHSELMCEELMNGLICTCQRDPGDYEHVLAHACLEYMDNYMHDSKVDDKSAEGPSDVEEPTVISNIKISDEMLEQAKRTLHSHRILDYPYEMGERTCIECGYAFRWNRVDLCEEEHRFSTHSLHVALEETIPSIAVQVLEEMARKISGKGPNELTYVSAVVAEIREQVKEIEVGYKLT